MSEEVTVHVNAGVSDRTGPPPIPLRIVKVVHEDQSSTTYSDALELCKEDYDRYNIPHNHPNIVEVAQYVRYRKEAPSNKRCYSFAAYIKK